MIHFSKSVNFTRYQLENNNLTFKNYTAIFNYERELIKFALRKTNTELCSRVSIKAPRNARKDSLDKISPAAIEEATFVGEEHDAVLLENVLHKQDSNESLNEYEHNRMVRVTIFYILWFFALASVTFFIIYLA